MLSCILLANIYFYYHQEKCLGCIASFNVQKKKNLILTPEETERLHARSDVTKLIRKKISGTSQWLRFHASTAGGSGLMPSWGTKIPHAAWHSQKIEKKILIKKNNSLKKRN